MTKVFRDIGAQKAYGFSMLAIFIINTSLLYLAIGGRMGATFSPVQPDSVLYICRGLELGNLSSAQISHLIDSLNANFRSPESLIQACGEMPDHLKSRFLLPFLIALFSLTNNAWFLVLPTILISACAHFLWWKITRASVEVHGVIGLLIGLSPWLSPHFGGHVSLVLTEGPLLLILLAILYLKQSNIEIRLYLLLTLCCVILGILNRQSWPILAIFVAYSITSRLGITSKLRSIQVYFFSTLVSFVLGSALTKSTSYSIAPNQLDEALIGVAKGILGDLIHLLKFLDLPGAIVIIAMIFLIAKNYQFLTLLPNVALLIVSIYSQGGIYLFDGSFSQNWRYYMPNGFFAIYILLTSINQFNFKNRLIGKKPPEGGVAPH